MSYQKAREWSKLQKQKYCKLFKPLIKQPSDPDKELDKIRLIYKNLTEKKVSSTTLFSTIKHSRSFINEIFPQTEKWRFFVEGIRQSEGLFMFEGGETGYFKNLYNAFSDLENTRTLNVDFIKYLHSTATKNIEILEDIVIPGKYRRDKVGGFDCDSEGLGISIKGVLAIFEKMKAMKENKNITYYFISNAKNPRIYCDADTLEGLSNEYGSKEELARFLCESGSLSFCGRVEPRAEETLEQALDENLTAFIEQYHINIKKAKNSADILKAIIILIQDCEQLHPFTDGNCRTLCMLLFAYLCMQNGFPPAIMFNPNSFDGNTVDELLGFAITGMKDTLSLVNGIKVLYQVSTEKLLENPYDRRIAESLDGMQELLKNTKPSSK